MTQHLTREAIERYVARRGEVDEILAAAEHLDVCFDCRDVAAAMVDDGTGERPHVRPHAATKRRPSRAHVLWLFAAVVLVLAVALLLLLQK